MSRTDLMLKEKEVDVVSQHSFSTSHVYTWALKKVLGILATQTNPAGFKCRSFAIAQDTGGHPVGLGLLHRNALNLRIGLC